MNKFVGKMTGEKEGEGLRNRWEFKHELKTRDFVFNIRSEGGSGDYLANVIAVDNETVVVLYSSDPPKQGEVYYIIIIG